MGLKEMLKQQPYAPEPENISMEPKQIEDLSARLKEAQQTIAGLKSKNSELQLENQELQSIVTTATEQIELLTSRAATVNKTEAENEKLSAESKKAVDLRDRALQEAERAAERARRDEARAREAEQRRADADRKQYEAEQATRQAQDSTRRAQTRYKSLFIGQLIFTVVLAALMAWSKRSVFSELGMWWADRAGDVVIAGRGIGKAFMWMAALLGHWGVPGAWPYVIAAAVSTGLLVGLFFLCRRLWAALIVAVGRVRKQYRDGVWKAVITVDIALGLFYICLWFYEPLRSVWPFNIFSLWLLLAAIGSIAWNLPEIKRGV